MYTNIILTLPGSLHLHKTKVAIPRYERKRLVAISLLDNPAVPMFNTVVTRKYSKVIKTIPITSQMDKSNLHKLAEDLRIDNQALSYKLV